MECFQNIQKEYKISKMLTKDLNYKMRVTYYSYIL